MTAAKTWEDLERAIERDDDEKFDVTFPVSSLGVVGDRIKFPEKVGPYNLRHLEMSPLALANMCSRTGVPHPFLETVDQRNPKLAESILRDAIRATDPGTKLLFRGKRDKIRAVLSDSYTAIDNRTVVDIIRDASFGAAAGVSGFYISDTDFHVKILFDDNHGADETAIGKELRGGFVVKNSEVGVSHLITAPFIWREICTNGMISMSRIGGGKVRHRDHTDLHVKRMIEREVAIAMREGGVLITEFLQRRENRILKPTNVISFLAAKAKLTKTTTNAVHAAFKVEPARNQFGVINAFTRAAQTQAAPTRLGMESFAGSLLHSDELWEMAA
jgi:hypothetical protein